MKKKRNRIKNERVLEIDRLTANLRAFCLSFETDTATYVLIDENSLLIVETENEDEFFEFVKSKNEFVKVEPFDLSQSEKAFFLSLIEKFFKSKFEKNHATAELKSS